MVSKGVKESLLGLIGDGEWEQGQQLPSEQQLALRFKVSRATVHKAMQSLAAEGLLDTSPGRRAVLAGPPEPVAPTRSDISRTVETLQSRIEQAMASGRLTVDAFCVTSESLVAAIQLQLLNLRAKHSVLGQFHIRLLVSSYSATPTFPRIVGRPDDRRPLARLRRITRDQVAALGTAVETLRTFRLVSQLPVVEVRTVPFPPTTKLYILNGVEVLEGFYQVAERRVEIDGEVHRLDDLAGLDSALFWRRSRPDLPTHVDSQYVRAAQAFFDSWWSKATPYGVALQRD